VHLLFCKKTSISFLTIWARKKWSFLGSPFMRYPKKYMYCKAEFIFNGGSMLWAHTIFCDFLQFSAKLLAFLKANVTIQILKNIAVCAFYIKRQFLTKLFSEIICKTVTLVPDQNVHFLISQLLIVFDQSVVYNNVQRSTTVRI
jgi:hypothetical protein